MEQTSKLGIVVDTRTAEGQLKAFRQSLREVQKYGENMDKSLSKLGSKSQFAGLVASLKSVQSNLQAFSGTAKNGATALNEFNLVAKSLQTSTKNISNNLNSAQASMTKFANGSKAISTNLQGANTGIAQTQTNLMKIIGSFNFASNASGKLSTSAKTLKADIAALNAALATGSGALGRFGQASNAAGAASNNARARNTELANSYRLVNTGLQSNAQYLQQANKAMAANSSAAVAAKLNQDKLAISSSKVATAASRAAEASTRAQIAVANLAAAGSRADAAISGASSAASRAAGAISNAAAAATRAESATSNLAAANSRAAAASSSASAAAARATGATSSAAAAASRAAAAVTGEAAARDRAAAAASRAAGAASNAAGAQDRAAAAAIRLASAEARAAADANRLAGGLGSANSQARGFMGTLQGLQGLLMGGMFSIATFGILKTSDEMQNLNSQIRIVTKSEGELLGVREKVRAIADQNFNDVSATTNLYQKSATALANLGKSQQEALIFTDAVSLAMRTGGRSAQEQSSAILQLGQAMGSGVLMGDEFRSIAENAPILLELVSRRMGVLPGQLKELASEGKITSEIMYDAFSQNINILEEMAKKMPLTMGQAFTRAKNQYKKYVDGIMNDTGGASSVIAKFITDIGDNFDTLAKVAIAGAGLAFVQMALSIGTATNAMKLFNLVTSANPLILVATGFIAVSSAIYGTNEVLTLSGLMIKDLMGELGDMANFLGNTWDDVSDWIMENVFQIEKAITDSNDKNRKSYFGFYEETEKGFAGLVQRIMGNVASVGALTGSALTYYQTFVDNLIISVTNLTTAFSNLYKMGANLFGADEKLGDFTDYKVMDIVQIYRNQNSANQDTVADYVRGANQRAGLADPTYSNELRSRYFKGGFGDLMTPGANSVLKPRSSIPSNLKAPNSQISTEPMDLIKKQQYDQLKAQEAITAATKEREKLAKEQAKSEKGLSNRLVGISGDTGVGNAHLHVQYRDKSRPVSAADLGRFQAGGKAITDYKMTSGYGKRNTGIKGASTNHKGTDFGVPKNTPITTNVAVKGVKTWKDGKGGGYVSTITFEDGVVIDLLHQMPSVMGVEKGSSTGNKQIDSMVAKAEGNIASAAAKAEKERIKAVEEAQKERERIAAIDLKLLKEYGEKELQLTIEHDARVAEINESSFNGAKKAELIKQSEQRMKQDLSVYKKGLDDKVSELVKFQKTERDLLRQQYDDEVFGIVSDSELSRPENKALLTQAITNAKLANDYRVSLYEKSLEQQKSAMYAFQKTERDVLIDSWDNKLADAELMYDELRDYRLEAIRIEGAQDINTFDTNQALKLLELKKYHMSEIAYIQARDALERKLIDLSNDPDDVKVLRKDAMTQAENLKKSDALDGVMSEIAQESPMGKIEADYQRRLEIIDDYESQWTSLVGVHSAERAAIEQSYMDAKRDLMLTQGEALFGDLAGLAKGFAGEQSGIYKGLFAVEKGFAIAQSAIAIQQSIAKAMALGFPQNIPVIGQAIAQGAGIMSSIKGITTGFKDGGYTGNMGVNQVAGAVHGQEYVFDAQATKRIGVDNLNAMRSGKSVGGEVQVNIINNSSARVQASDDGKTITISDVNNAVDRKFDSLANPNSHASKAINRNLNATRRR